MKNLSEAAKKRISTNPDTRREHMAALARLRHTSKTPEERSAHAKMMVEAREAKRRAI